MILRTTFHFAYFGIFLFSGRILRFCKTLDRTFQGFCTFQKHIQDIVNS
jgi:hypothetical protein